MPSPTLPVSQQLNMEAPIHNGLNYSDMLARLEMKVSITQIADDFGVTRPTVYSWINKDQKMGGLYAKYREDSS